MTLKSNIDDFFYDERQLISSGAISQNIDIIMNFKKEVVYVQSLSIKNNVSAAGKADLYLVRGGKELHLDTILFGTAGFCAIYDFTGYFLKPDFLRIKVVNTNANDVIQCVLHGFDYEQI